LLLLIIFTWLFRNLPPAGSSHNYCYWRSEVCYNSTRLFSRMKNLEWKFSYITSQVCHFKGTAYQLLCNFYLCNLLLTINFYSNSLCYEVCRNIKLCLKYKHSSFCFLRSRNSFFSVWRSWNLYIRIKYTC
jgi:hypothetical protein